MANEIHSVINILVSMSHKTGTLLKELSLLILLFFATFYEAVDV